MNVALKWTFPIVEYERPGLLNAEFMTIVQSTHLKGELRCNVL